MKGRTRAKVNLSLRVLPPRPDGLHPVVSLAQSIEWCDVMTMQRADEDDLVAHGPLLPDREQNLAWRAVDEVRGRAGRPVKIELEKQIPIAAGLGGGSADAALALALAVGVLGFSIEDAVRVAPRVGADVPFCLAGGTAWMEGVGERLTRVETPGDFWLGVVVPPFELPTADVYRRWDDMDGPTVPGVEDRQLPVSIREHGPLGNDLTSAAIDLMPGLGDWISDLSSHWGQPVLMSGSGPSLFAFFASASEADDAVASVDGAREARACSLASSGWEIDNPGVLPRAPWM